MCPDASSCTTCNTNYTLGPTGTCNDCVEPCSTCADDGTCVGCLTGYYLENAQCYACITNCDTCPSPFICSACQTGFYFDGTSCTSCGLYCRTCSQTSGKCSQCLEGYQMSSGDCALCTDGSCTCTGISNYAMMYMTTSSATGIVLAGTSLALLAVII